MRWQQKKKNRPLHVNTRIKTRFLIFPVVIRESGRWLEKATTLQQYSVAYGWCDVAWEADEEIGGAA